ncbi:tyrosine-type recombinase/integrase [Pseudomonas sp. OV226]|uniref:tyrosine-type recombinase/integrase n=1 Tax=Pseudomonas sp. OV226 TaxID=2135588 RepID=UPI000D6C9005|nr:tyrosine-type recombinase/integrase [Pseudomonas sp. OV226]PWK30010.1 site-specific recombinase XerD [Pseudomonas sp. OV226]
MIHTADFPDLDFLFNHGLKESMPFPMIFGAAGNFCWEMNSYLTKYGGGANSYGARPLAKTVISYATTLNVFQNYLERNLKTLIEVDDELLYSFVKHLQEIDKANSTTIKRTVRRILLLIEHTQSDLPSLKLLTTDFSASNFQVYASEAYGGRGTRRQRYLSHACIDGMKDTPVAPIDYIKNSEIVAWHEAIFEYTNNDYIIERWYAFTALLENTGSRLSEVIEIPASAVIEAYTTNSSLKKIPVLKGKYKGFHRTVTIPRSELQEIYKFVINTHERFPNSKIHDRIFVNSQSGEIMYRKSFNSYYEKVIKASKHSKLLLGISHHNFRHRYFTILIARNISNLSKKSKANILDVAMAAGRQDSMHATQSTLARYVHLTNDPEIQEILTVGTDVESTASSKLAKIDKLRQAYLDGASAEETLNEILGLL